MTFSHPNDDERNSLEKQGEAASFTDDELIQLHGQEAREKGEPSEGFAPVPTVVVIFICMLASFCFFYMEHNTHGFSGMVFDNEQSAETASSAVGPVEETLEMRLKKGAKIFNQQCATCHQPDGKGTPGVYPPLAESPYVVGDPGRSISIVLAGISGPIEVLGKSYNNNMPELGSSLKDKQIADVLTYVRQSFGNQAEAVSPEKVAEVRKEIGKRSPWSAVELLKVHPLETQ